MQVEQCCVQYAGSHYRGTRFAMWEGVSPSCVKQRPIKNMYNPLCSEFAVAFVGLLLRCRKRFSCRCQEKKTPASLINIHVHVLT